MRMSVAILGLLLLAATWPKDLVGRCRASEFPERECCDPIYPLPEPTNRMPTLPSHTGKTGSEKTIAILNCLYARKLCYEHPSCSAILVIIPRVCGPEVVACSTVTVTKCQAALRSLQAFDFFKPTCLCREPHIDPECNSFRDFLFDHPCLYAMKKEKDPYSIEALPTCNQALSGCHRGTPCMQVYNDFKMNCKTKDGRCRMENRDACYESWNQLRLSPMFGCICPNNEAKKRCYRIFSVVNHNPCVNVISNTDNTTKLIESQVENPLIDADHLDLHSLKQLPIPNVHHNRVHHKQKNQSHEDHDGGQAASSSVSDNERIAQQPPKVVLSSTCHHAYTACKNDAECSVLLQPVLNRCDHSSCSHKECMAALQHFYKMASHKFSMEIAFCLCLKSEGKRNECTLAREKLHPVCAQRIPADTEIPTCNTLAEDCRHDSTCSSKLEHYEQNCAVDSVTQECAGPPQGCRTALLGILGTKLRTNCACKAADLAPLYECLGWQRLLRVNPCVGEAQRDFHARRLKHHGHGRSTPSTPTVITPRASLVAATSFTETEEQSPEEETEEEADEQAAFENNVIPDVTDRQTAESPGEPTTVSSTTTTTTRATTTTTTTTTSTTTTTMRPTTPSTTTTSTPPPRFCVVQRPRQSHQYIRVGKGKRLYGKDESECSELCQCGENEILTCNTICVESSPCKTDFAFYNHAAPAYQAFRGRCLCYSGRFICMRPSPDAYNIPHGVFMFLGYSETDENLLKPHNNLTMVDAVSSLDNFMREEVNNQTICTLFLYNVTKENVIAIARLATDNASSNNLTQAQSLQHLLRIKEECASMLQDLSEKINNRHQEVHTHPLLSIFKMAEVEIKLPRTSGVSALSSSLLLVALLVLAVTS